METVDDLKQRFAELETEVRQLRAVQKAHRAETQSSTPYDNAWRTLSTCASQLLIPLVNEAFGEHFSHNAKVVQLSNEHLFSSPEGRIEKRITDSNFTVQETFGDRGSPGSGFDISEGAILKHYLIEPKIEKKVTLHSRLE